MPPLEESDKHPELKYIPQLDLYYDEAKEIYLSDDGYVVNRNMYNKRASDKKEAGGLDSMKFDLASVIKIVSVTSFIVGQYYVFDGKFRDVKYDLKTAESKVDALHETISDLQRQNAQITAQQNLQNELYNNLQLKIASMGTKK